MMLLDTTLHEAHCLHPVFDVNLLGIILICIFYHIYYVMNRYLKFQLNLYQRSFIVRRQYTSNQI